jgi:flagellar biosynthesis protein FlhB
VRGQKVKTTALRAILFHFTFVVLVTATLGKIPQTVVEDLHLPASHRQMKKINPLRSLRLVYSSQEFF